jgi:hypothetical protein
MATTSNACRVSALSLGVQVQGCRPFVGDTGSLVPFWLLQGHAHKACSMLTCTACKRYQQVPLEVMTLVVVAVLPDM